MLEMLTIDPATLRSIIPFATIWETINTARRLMAWGIPRLRLGLEERLQDRDSSVVDEKINLSRLPGSPSGFFDFSKVGHDRLAVDFIAERFKVRWRPAHGNDPGVETVEHDGDLATDAFASACHQGTTILEVNLQGRRIEFHGGKISGDRFARFWAR
jgi:hypothetical protein